MSRRLEAIHTSALGLTSVTIYLYIFLYRKARTIFGLARRGPVGRDTRATYRYFPLGLSPPRTLIPLLQDRKEHARRQPLPSRLSGLCGRTRRRGVAGGGGGRRPHGDDLDACEAPCASARHRGALSQRDLLGRHASAS